MRTLRGPLEPKITGEYMNIKLLSKWVFTGFLIAILLFKKRIDELVQNQHVFLVGFVYAFGFGKE
jgi:hypothetical protein